MHGNHGEIHNLARYPNHPQLFHGFPELSGILAPNPFPVSSLDCSLDTVKDWKVNEGMVDGLIQKHLCGDGHSVAVIGLQWRTKLVKQLVVEPVLS